MTGKKISPSEFLGYRALLPVVDVRSPSEYLAGHIPSAVNIPLFNDTERAAVGLTYKVKGREESVREGLKLIGPSLGEKFTEALRLSKGGRLLMYCWRGGMRSESMAWMLGLSGLTTFLLEGGYKAYRNHILGQLASRRNILILGGLTGSGKTAVLNLLGDRGEQVADLEDIASHKGAAFGSLGQGQQPTTEQFANNLFDIWKRFDFDRTIWLEDESRNIGSVFLPEQFYRNMQESPVIALISRPEVRLPRLVEEYCCYPVEMLKASVMKISRRLGGDRTGDAVRAIESGDLEKAAEIVLVYYDRTYLYSLEQRKNHMVHRINTDTADPEINAARILEYAGKHNLLSAD
jgi:tRNA 2-selenouridine synthase